ncbi:endonuclease/exonuclease/phosphatase family protein [Nocardioides abyssi]|uniref:Endonuclease/exonuclease/phosphatase family protein n=1 Tax=Nocardioides abyssi TaxID=3058370 RepID=A0ABT8EW96_9ACTN|nr:endonuclease/exonuclease/phosphatase family protein [Nocardioides abyssi]MDN4162236.1 endonuclease/exonuclease/phosphatase family protein [Nocardioides abyssi]
MSAGPPERGPDRPDADRPDKPGHDDERGGERRAALATVGAVVAIVLVVVGANLLTRGGDGTTPAAQEPSSAPSRTNAAELAGMTPQEIAEAALLDRGEVASAAPQAVPSGADKLRNKVQELVTEQPYSFTMTTFNILGSQHSAPGGAAAEFAPGRVRTEWAARLVASYGSSIVGLQEIQSDQLSAMARATDGRFAFWPGTALGGKGVPQSLMWDTAVWSATYQDSITVPFMGGTRPQPVVRLQHVATGREVYVLNIHNSPKDRQGREDERDKAEQIEVAAVNTLKKDGIPVFIMGDFNEHEDAFCRFTGEAGMRAANGGSNDGACRPPRPMRVDWIFGTPEVQFSGFRMDTGPAVRRITDHAVITTQVTVP